MGMSEGKEGPTGPSCGVTVLALLFILTATPMTAWMVWG